MQVQFTISAELAKMLDQHCRQTGQTREEVAATAIAEHLAAARKKSEEAPILHGLTEEDMQW